MSKERLIKLYSTMGRHDIVRRCRKFYNIVDTALVEIPRNEFNRLVNEYPDDRKSGCRNAVRSWYNYNAVYAEYIVKCCDMIDYTNGRLRMFDELEKFKNASE